MRTWHFTWMHSGTNDETLLLRTKFFRLVMIRKQMLTLIFLIFAQHPFLRRYSNKLNWSSLQSSYYIRSLEVDILLFTTFLLDLFQESVVISIWPGVEKSKEYFLVGCHCMFKCPLYPSLVKFLHDHFCTIREVSTRWAILFQSWLPSYLYTGSSPSLRRRDLLVSDVPDFAYFWYWKWQVFL